MMELLTDEDLIVRVRQGSPDAYRVLVDRHKQGVFTLIRCKVESKETAEDLAQEVFLKVYRCIPGFREEARFGTWLYRITLNTVTDYLRARRRRPVTAMLDTVKGWFGEPGELPEEQAIRREKRETVVHILRCLPEKYRDILFLYHYRQLSCSEIAQLMELPVKTVETRLYRAKSMMKQQWQEVNAHECHPSGRPNAGAVSKS
jgi:RNA polymerase sigma factor (sigma-70 family)